MLRLLAIFGMIKVIKPVRRPFTPVEHVTQVIIVNVCSLLRFGYSTVTSIISVVSSSSFSVVGKVYSSTSEVGKYETRGEAISKFINVRRCTKMVWNRKPDKLMTG
jgi:hypothetical protein